MSESEEGTLRISPETVPWSLAAGTLLLLLLAVVGQYFRWQGVEHYLIGQFDLDVATWSPHSHISAALSAGR